MNNNMNNNIKLSSTQINKFRSNLSKRIQNINTISKKNYTKKNKNKYTKKNEKQNTYVNEYEIKVYDDHNKYINGIDIIYWINLDRSIERRKRMEKVLKNFNIKNKRIKASDGKLESDEDIYGKFICDNFVNNKLEYACLLSHLNTIKEFANSNYETALIFEDDVSLEFSIYWDKSVTEIIKDAPKDWNIIMLSYQCSQKLKDLYTENTSNINNKTNKQIWSALAYIINKKGANDLLNKIIDNNKYNISSMKYHEADYFIYKNLKTYAYKYPYFTYPNNNDSNINNNLKLLNILKKNTLFTWQTYNLEKNKNKNKNIINFKLTKKQTEKIHDSISIKLQNLNSFNKNKVIQNDNNYYETYLYDDHKKYINGIDIIYWINLDRSIDRRKRMELVLKKFNIKNKRIKASDGKLESDNDIYEKFTTDKFKMSKLEYACLLSHLNTIKEFANSNYENALILEDDISLEFSIFWDKNISKIISEAPEDWDIIMLGYLPPTGQKLINIYTDNTIQNNIYSTLSYIINKKSALKFINSIYINNKYYLTSNINHQADVFIYKSLKTYTYKYPYFTYISNNISTIEHNIYFHNYSKFKTIEIWTNYILDKIKINGENIYLINNENKDFIYDKYLIVNSYGFYAKYYCKHKHKHKHKNQIKYNIIINIKHQNIYIYINIIDIINKKLLVNILSKNDLIIKLNKIEELKFILDYIKSS